jgi:GGDEF domain-containing protein
LRRPKQIYPPSRTSRTAEAFELWECDIYRYDAGENRTTDIAIYRAKRLGKNRVEVNQD